VFVVANYRATDDDLIHDVNTRLINICGRWHTGRSERPGAWIV